MSIKKVLAFILAAAMVLSLGPAALASEDPDTLYKQGREAFDAGDMESALELFTTAAEAGSGDAAGMLAYMYSDGMGVEPDPELAFQWASRGADGGVSGHRHRGGGWIDDAVSFWQEQMETDWHASGFSNP